MTAYLQIKYLYIIIKCNPFPLLTSNCISGVPALHPVPVSEEGMYKHYHQKDKDG